MQHSPGRNTQTEYISCSYHTVMTFHTQEREQPSTGKECEGCLYGRGHDGWVTQPELHIVLRHSTLLFIPGHIVVSEWRGMTAVNGGMSQQVQLTLVWGVGFSLPSSGAEPCGVKPVVLWARDGEWELGSSSQRSYTFIAIHLEVF